MSHCLSSKLLLVSALSYIVIANPIVHVPGLDVAYHGLVSNSIEHFQNIKFAEDTSGKNRFSTPQPHVPAKHTVIDASQPGSVCPQSEAAMPLAFDETPKVSEDCLNLRIARHSGAGASADSKLPVIVWLHGGGVVKGSAYDSHADPDNLLRLSTTDGTPVIYAAINYRLTIFGFPRLPLLKDQGALNLGIRDQRLGLQWIQNNIHAFGGDPERITVFGLSSGGTFASLQTMAYGGKHGAPFQQVWAMSGPPGTALNMSSDATTAHTMNVAEKLGCQQPEDQEILDCLRAIPMEDLLDTAMSYSVENHPPMGLFTFIPSIDDDIIPDRQSSLVRDGRFVKGIKMIFGWTQNDGAMNAGPAQLIQSEEDMIASIRSFASGLSQELLTELFNLYPTSAFQQELDDYESRKVSIDPSISVHFFRVSRILRDVLFTCPSIEFGYQMVKQTREIQPEFDSVRLYDLNQSAFTPMITAAGMPYAGVIHGSDMPYIFNGYPEGSFNKPDEDLATAFSRSLLQFAYNGTPISYDAKTSKPESPKQFFEWPAAYPSVVTNRTESIPSEFNIEVIGGVYGTGPILVKEENGSGLFAQLFYKDESQRIVDTIADFSGMGSASESVRKQLIEAEDLHKRCAYIASLNEALGR